MINHRLTFIGDTSSRMVEIRTIEDETFEEPETFVVLITLITLLSGPGMTKVDNRRSNITVTIDDDDPRIRGRKFNNLITWPYHFPLLPMVLAYVYNMIIMYLCSIPILRALRN